MILPLRLCFRTVFIRILFVLLCSFSWLFLFKNEIRSATIAEAEYFFDKDPGEGNGLRLTAADGAFNSDAELIDFSDIDISSLRIGYHTIFVRFKSSDGIWGIPRPISNDDIFASPYNVRFRGEKWIDRAEFFIDADPGVGNGTPVFPEDGFFDESEEDLNISGIDLSALNAGLHTLFLRVKDNEGTWGIIRKVSFEIHEPATISAAEYFVDNDPGPGNGTLLPPKDGSFDSSEEEVDLAGLDLTGLAEGVHTVNIRFKDSHGKWGSVSRNFFSINRPLAYASSNPIQPSTGDRRVPLEVIASDQFRSATCMLKVEFAPEGSDEWSNISIVEGSVSATYGSPSLDNRAEYQIGSPAGWIDASSGPITVSIVWDFFLDLGEIEAGDYRLRYTIHNGTMEHVTSTESEIFSIDGMAPGIPVPVSYQPDPTGDTTPILTWGKVEDAVDYHIQVAKDHEFNNLIIEQADVTDSSFTPINSLPAGNIYWRVSAIDSVGNESDFSSADHFEIVADTKSPTVILNYSEPTPVAAGPLVVTAKFSEPVATIPEITIDQPGSEDVIDAPMQGSGGNWTFVYHIQCSDGLSYLDGIAAVTITNGIDYAGNVNEAAQNSTFLIDTGSCGSGTIVAAEYFFDSDPGEGNATPISAADGDFDSDEEAVDLPGINLSKLKTGNHTLCVRFKSSEGIWGVARPIRHDQGFNSPYNFQVKGDRWVAAAEYFIDVDPGEGYGIPVNAADGMFDENEEELELRDIDVSHLGVGSHELFLRARDNEGNWGVVRVVPLEIYEPAVIADAEYFIDEDPGLGKGTPVPPKDGLFNSTEEEVELPDIDLSAIAEGVHTINLRFKDNNGRWGALSTHFFSIDRPISFAATPPVQPSSGDGRIPLSVAVTDHSGSNT